MASPEAHTPTPWIAQRGPSQIEIMGGDICIAHCGKAYVSTLNAAFIVRACNNHDALVKAACELLATHPVFRSKPMGGEGSQARLHQQDQIAAEDALRDILNSLEPTP